MLEGLALWLLCLYNWQSCDVSSGNYVARK